MKASDEVPPSSSIPIPMFAHNSKLSDGIYDAEESYELHSISNSDSTDFIDDQGHIWRKKYCILDDGILYFYRNISDAESTEASHERERDKLSSGFSIDGAETGAATVHRNSSELSKSPMTRNRNVWNPDSDKIQIVSSSIWEKRVALDCVAAVRSAEREYGPNSFELQGVAHNEVRDSSADTLVLRAQDQQSMKEWIFQFHRSLASFVRNVMDVVGCSNAYLYSDHSMTTTLRPFVDTLANDDQQFRRRWSQSPYLSQPSSFGKTLSHGHGRVNALRRKHSSPVTKSDESESILGPLPKDKIGTITLVGPNAQSSELPFVLENDGSIDESGNFSMGNTVAAENYDKYPFPNNGNGNTAQSMLSSTNGLIDDKMPGFQNVGSSLPVRRYIPPKLRSRTEEKLAGARTLEERATIAVVQKPILLTEVNTLDILDIEDGNFETCHLGGCADPNLVPDSIMNPANIPRKASAVPSTSQSKPFGRRAFGKEIGAVSECGIRDSNEDAYLIAPSLVKAFAQIDVQYESEEISLFAIFDGHCGNQAARYAAENLISFVEKEIHLSRLVDRKTIGVILQEAMINLDEKFCQICHEEGREWESGTTALVAVLLEESLVVANLGDCRGILCRTVEDKTLIGNDWDTFDDKELSSQRGGLGALSCCAWREVARIHKPSDEQERDRIENANGWITTETEIPIGQLRRMDFLDEEVRGILRRCFSDRYEDSGGGVRECRSAPQRILTISRVCGELAVSRAIGDRDFKAKFHGSSLVGEDNHGVEKSGWDSPLFLSFPTNHSRTFTGDLIHNIPDVVQIKINDCNSTGEFLLFASDGLWVCCLILLCQILISYEFLTCFVFLTCLVAARMFWMLMMQFVSLTTSYF